MKALQFSDGFSASFASAGLAVDHGVDLEEVELLISTNIYAAVMLDRGVPDGDGMTLPRHSRRSGDTVPAIMLTANGDVKARIDGLDTGVDDYVSKPFAVDEVLARIRAVLRCNGNFQGCAVTLQLDLDNRVLVIEGSVVPLSTREAGPLRRLLRRCGQVVTKRLDEDQPFDMHDFLGLNAIEGYVHRLRQKLDGAGSSAEGHTVRGLGYLIRPRG